MPRYGQSPFLGALGGSLNQILVPAVCTGYFVWHRQHAASAVTLFWAGENVVDVATYVADARDMRLPVWDKPAMACLASRIPSGRSLAG